MRIGGTGWRGSVVRTMVGAVRRLLDELSWESNARKYRGGGLGLENVLTTEVFQALDFLPRGAFLGAVLRAATGADAARGQAAAEVEQAVVDLVPDDLVEPDLSLRVQPDAGDQLAVRVRIRRGQADRDVAILGGAGGARDAGDCPPRRGTSATAAAGAGLAAAAASEGTRRGARRGCAADRHGECLRAAGARCRGLGRRFLGRLRHLVRVATQAGRAVADYPETDDGTGHTVQRLAASLMEAVQVHG